MATPIDRYQLPALLRDLQLLDTLELTGSTEQAGRWLGVSQPTVSRRCSRLAAEFGLGSRPRRGPAGRAGSCASLRLLRLAARWHRFEAGVAAVGADPLHQPLLGELEGVLPMPARFRQAATWHWLIREAVLDAALVSSLELEAPGAVETAGLPPSPLRRVPDTPRGVMELCLGSWPLDLATVDLAWSSGRLLVPPRALAPGLNALLRTLGLQQEPMEDRLAAEPLNWPERLAAGDLALALPALMPGGMTDPFPGLRRRASGLRQRLWLLLPARWWEVRSLLRLSGRLRALGPDGQASHNTGTGTPALEHPYWGGGGGELMAPGGRPVSGVA